MEDIDSWAKNLALQWGTDLNKFMTNTHKYLSQENLCYIIEYSLKKGYNYAFKEINDI